MNMIGKIILLGLALALLVPSVYAIQVGLAGSSNGVGFSDGMTLTGTKDASLAVQNTVSGGTLSQTVIGSGRLDLHKTFTADDNAGEIAKIIVDVSKAGTLNYVQPTVTETSTSASLAGFTLTATDAAEIDCTSKATNRLGDKAVSSIDVLQGSLNNYKSSAYADTIGAGTDQSLDGANGNSINIENKATNVGGDKAVSSTYVQRGSLNNYGSSAWANPDPADVAAPYNIGTGTSQKVLGVNGNSINIEEKASSELGSARTSTMISQGTISDYWTTWKHDKQKSDSNLAVYDWVITGIHIGGMSGRSIELQSITNNADAGSVSSSDTIAKNAVVTRYGSKSESYISSKHSVRVSESVASQGADTILGSNIQHLTKSIDKSGDKSSIYTEVQSGSDSRYSDSTRASLLSSSGASSVYATADQFTASGDKIHLDATTIDLAGNKATAITEVTKGTIGGVTNNADVISASQVGNGVTGNKLTLDATAINAAMLKATGSQRVLNPNNIAFHNAASVTTGVPAVDQGVP